MNTRELRQSARLIWEAALNAANPATFIRKFLRVHDNVLNAGGKDIEIRGRLIVIGAGKPSAKMAQTVEEILGSHITGGVVVTKYGHARSEEHTSELQSLAYLVCRLLLEKKK